MKLVNLFFVGVCFLLISTNIVNAQVQKVDEARANPNPKVRASASKLPTKTMRAASKNNTAELNKEETKSVLNENDPYMGRQQEILGRLTVPEIPADFPKYKKGYGIKYYNDLMDGYYIMHPNVTQKWVTDKLNHGKH